MPKKKTKAKSAPKGNLTKRPPVVVVVGHVDHGKTTLLDQIRKTNIAEKEAGGITQKIGAYEIEVKKGKNGGKELITFLDTPGHEAFSGMRSRGVKVADIAILVVAADDGVQPQTIEAIKFAQEAKLPLIVAFNKTDRPQADVAKTKKQLSEQGVLTEDWGGQVLSAEISAKTGAGIENLLESVILLSEMEDLKADADIAAEGIVLESKSDAKKGILTALLIKKGTLKMRDIVLAGITLGKIKRIENFRGKTIKSAGPSTPVVVMGMESLARPGEIFGTYKNIDDAQKIISERIKQSEAAALPETETAMETKAQEETKTEKNLNLILKADSEGTLEALHSILTNTKIEGIKLNIFKKRVGDINENDIKEASVTSSTIVGFNSAASAAITELAKQKKVRIITNTIVYKLIEETKDLAVSLLPPKITKTVTGKLQVIALFKTKKGAGEVFESVFGAKVIDGKIPKGANIEIFHNNVSAGIGKVIELQLNKNAADEVAKPNNAGIHYKGSAKIEMNDILEAYTEEIVRRKLE